MEEIIYYLVDNPVEAISTFFGIICVYLNAKENIWAWPTGIISVGLGIYIFLQFKLYGDMGLHIIYVILGFYGWYNWLYGGKKQEGVKIHTAPNKEMQAVLLGGGIGTAVLGYFLDTNTDSDVPYLDALTTVFSLIAQYQLTKKLIENWLIWIAVDVICIGLYYYKGLYIFTFLYFVYLLLATMGYLNWRKLMLRQEFA
jgi:nicotinamide mononucleotide transporter